MQQLGPKAPRMDVQKTKKIKKISKIHAVNAHLETTPEKTQKIDDFESLQMLLNRAETLARTLFSHFQRVTEKTPKMSQKKLFLGASGHQEHRKVRKSDALTKRQQS